MLDSNDRPEDRRRDRPRDLLSLQALEPRGDGPAPLVFKRGAHSPFAVRWFGITSLFGHTRNFIASAIASEQIDSRDWMRPEDACKLLRSTLRVLGGNTSATSLVEGLARPLWIDFVADTGDDRDVSVAVGRMIFAGFEVRGADGTTRELPRGDVLMFGGDTAYPVGTVDEIHHRVVAPWNEILRERERAGDGQDERVTPRVLIGIPGNHDWYDGLDGFARLFRRSVNADGEHYAVRHAASEAESRRRVGRKSGIVMRQLHLDEVSAFFRLLARFGASVRALLKGSTVVRRKRLALLGYEAVQESTFWAMPLAPKLDVYGVDRQLSRLDFRQRAFFHRRRKQAPDARVLFVAPDPAIAFGETWEVGARMLAGCRLGLEDDEIFYLSGDMHHYERRVVGSSLHVIAGGGGAFLHGTRIRVGPGGPPERAYPDAATSRRLVAQVPLRLMIGGAGLISHFWFALVAVFELGASLRGTTALIAVSIAITLLMTIAFYLNAGSKRTSRLKVAAVAVPFGVVLGLLPLALRLALPALVPVLAGDTVLVVLYAFLGALGFGLFLTTLAILGLEHQQAYSVLSHPGFKHFVRLCVHPDGRIEAWTIGKDDPISAGPPVLIDAFSWSRPPTLPPLASPGEPTAAAKAAK